MLCILGMVATRSHTLDCWGFVPRYWHVDYYGGTHAMIWRSDSINKIKKIWSVQPYDDIDGLLTFF